MIRRLFAATTLASYMFVGVTLLAQTTRDEVMRAEESLRQASMKGDKTAYASLLADEFTWTFIDGRVIDKKQRIDSLPARGIDVTSKEVRVQQYENTAVVVGRAELIMGGRPITERFVRIWVKRDGRWQLVLFQATQIAQ